MIKTKKYTFLILLLSTVLILLFSQIIIHINIKQADKIQKIIESNYSIIYLDKNITISSISLSFDYKTNTNRNDDIDLEYYKIEIFKWPFYIFNRGPISDFTGNNCAFIDNCKIDDLQSLKKRIDNQNDNGIEKIRLIIRNTFNIIYVENSFKFRNPKNENKNKYLNDNYEDLKKLSVKIGEIVL